MSVEVGTETEPEVEDFLAHFGVKGMKWGKRKSGGSDSSKAADSASSAKKEAPKTNGKSVIDGVLKGVGALAVSAVVVNAAANLTFNRMFNEEWSLKKFD